MSQSKSKTRRYLNIFRTVNNWGEYLYKKATGFGDYFEFDIKNFGKIKVVKNTLGPFRENFFDDVYLSKVPKDNLNKPGAIIIDIGANIGYFSLSFLSRYPEAKIYAYEPHPYCFEQLKKYREEFPQFDLQIYKKAVGEKAGNLVLYASKLDGFATMSSIFEGDNKKERFEIESITLEHIIEDKGLDHIDLIKLDCEGSEYPIIYSASDQVLDKIESFCIETHRGKLENENLPSLVKYLQSKKFKTEHLDEGGTGYIWAWR